MILGLAGSHRSGKTTLARAVAAKGGIAFYDGSFGRLARTLGFESVARMSIFERLTMQNRVLDLYDREIRQDAAARITDRTPLDMLAYLVAEVGMHAGLGDAASRRWSRTGTDASASPAICSTTCSCCRHSRSTSWRTESLRTTPPTRCTSRR